MNKNHLMLFSSQELLENLNRLETAVDDLDYCLETLTQESDELQSTNQMLKQTLQSLNLNLFTNFLDSSKVLLKSSKSFIELNFAKIKTSGTSLMKSLTPKNLRVGSKAFETCEAIQASPEEKTETPKKQTFISPRRFVMSKLNRLE